MEALSWVSNYPAGIMVVDDKGNVNVPPSNAHQTVVQTAQTRGMDLINAGSTHKLKPLNLEAFENRNKNSQRVTLIILFLILGLSWYKRIWIGLLLIGIFIYLIFARRTSVLFEKISDLLI